MKSEREKIDSAAVKSIDLEINQMAAFRLMLINFAKNPWLHDLRINLLRLGLEKKHILSEWEQITRKRSKNYIRIG